MKSTLAETINPTEITYPCLMQLGNIPSLVVLFTDPKTGTVVGPAIGYKLGDHLTSWTYAEAPAAWTLFVGKVILEN